MRGRPIGNLAGQGRQRGRPFLVAAWLAGAEIDTQGAELCRAGRLLCPCINIALPGDGEIDKSGGHDRGLKLCFQQSTGNSTCPQADIAFGVFGNSFLHQNITNLQTAVGFENARHFGQRRGFVGHQVEHAIRDDHIRPGIGDG